MTREWDSLTWNEKCALDADRAAAEDEAYNARRSVKRSPFDRQPSHEQIEGAARRFV